MLEGAGAARGARDASGRAPNHYRGAARTLLALPTVRDMPPPQEKGNGKYPPVTYFQKKKITWKSTTTENSDIYI